MKRVPPPPGAPRVMPLLRDLLRVARTDGWRPTAGRLLDRIRRSLYRRDEQLVLLRALPTDSATVAPARRIRVERGSPAPVLLAPFADRQLSRSRALERHSQIGRGREALLCFVDDELIGYLWWIDARSEHGSVDAKRLNITLAPDDVYVYDVFLVPWHRGARI
jgi:hypothetical protein